MTSFINSTPILWTMPFIDSIPILWMMSFIVMHPLPFINPLVVGGTHLGQPCMLGGGTLCIHPLPITMAWAPAFHNLDPLKLILTPSSHPTLLCLITCLILSHPPPCNRIHHHRHRR